MSVLNEESALWSDELSLRSNDELRAQSVQSFLLPLMLFRLEACKVFCAPLGILKSATSQNNTSEDKNSLTMLPLHEQGFSASSLLIQFSLRLRLLGMDSPEKMESIADILQCMLSRWERNYLTVEMAHNVKKISKTITSFPKQMFLNKHSDNCRHILLNVVFISPFLVRTNTS